MVIRWNPQVLNKYIAPGIAQFMSCDIPDVQQEHPEASYWLTNHFLNSAVRLAYGNEHRQRAFNVIFRAQITFARFHEARLATIAYLEGNSPQNPKVGAYFAMLALWESCLLNLQMFVDVFNKLNGEPIFQPGDGSSEHRAYTMANVIKHWGGQIRAGTYGNDETVPLWISNTALHTRTAALSFAELAQITREVAVVADELQDPKNFLPGN